MRRGDYEAVFDYRRKNERKEALKGKTSGRTLPAAKTSAIKINIK